MMKTLLVLSFIIIVSLSISSCKDLVMGTNSNAALAWRKKVEYLAIPFMKRVKDFFYANPNQQLITAIILKDLEHTDATAIITAGGVGTSYANIRLKSKRGDSLNYQMEIYV